MRKFTIDSDAGTIVRGGRAATFGVGLACWPREWTPDPGRELGLSGFGFHFNVGNLIKGAVHDVGSVAKTASKISGDVVKVAEHQVSGAAKFVTKVGGEAFTNPLQAIRDIKTEVGKVAKVAKFLLEQTQGLISLVPGIGTGISTAIGAALAVLEGGSPLDMAIKIAYSAIPIPPGIKVFTDLVLGATLDIINALVKGGDMMKVLERLIAEELSRALPESIRSAGTTVLTTLGPTVLAAVTGKMPSLSSVASTAAGAAANAAGLPASLPAAANAIAASAGLPTSLPDAAKAAANAAGLPTSIPSLSSVANAAGLPTSIPPIPAVSSVTSALTSALPSVAGLPSISVPSIPGLLGDKIDDFVATLKSQYAGINLPANVRQEIDPIFNVLVSMIHSMDVGPAILLAVRTGIGAKLPSGAVRDIGLRIFDTLAHIILGKLFKKPTQAKTSAKMTKPEITAIHLAATRGQPLPPTVTPIPPTLAAYKPLAAAEQAKKTEVSVDVPPPLPGTGYGPYPLVKTGGIDNPFLSPINAATSPSTAMTPPPVPAAGTAGLSGADDDVLRVMAIDLLGSLRNGVPQGATRPVRNFAQAWNTASADTQVATDGKYTREIEGALNAALSALSPNSGAAPAAAL